MKKLDFQYTFLLLAAIIAAIYFLVIFLNRNIKKPKHFLIFISVLLGLAILITLPFHYVISRDKLFPKENLTFSNTFITEDDISDLIKRYNDASYMEKIAIRNEPLFRKLMEKGILVEKQNEEEKSDK